MDPLTRRAFLRRAGVTAGGLALWARGAPLLGGGALAARGAVPFARPLPSLLELTGDHLTIDALEAEIPILDGAPTRMWTFGGTFPGPLVRRPSGAHTEMTVRHRLPVAADTLTIHLHGGHTASLYDGQPERFVIQPTGFKTYKYGLTEAGAPQRGALHWFHDHSHLRTGRNIWRGLLGLFLVDDGVDAALGLPTGAHDIPLVVCDRRFDDANQLVDPFTAPGREEQSPLDSLGNGWPPGDEVVGDVVLVNGVPLPYLDVEPRRYRFRILNASNFQPFNIAVGSGHELVQVGTESGLLPAPVRRRSVLLGPAERAEVVVDLAPLAGSSVVLESVPVAGPLVPATPPPVTPLLQLRVGPGPVSDPTVVPPTLRPLPSWVGGLNGLPDRVWAFGLGTDRQGRMAWTINGRAFEPTRIDARPELGSVETWLLVNTTPLPISHYIHIHDVSWYTISRNLRTPPPEERALKETFRLDPGEVVVVAARFTDHLGPYMLHCHMLEHEDHGMMTTFEVVPPGRGDRPGAAVDSLVPAERRRVESVLDEVAVTGQPASRATLAALPPLVLDAAAVCTVELR